MIWGAMSSAAYTPPFQQVQSQWRLLAGNITTPNTETFYASIDISSQHDLAPFTLLKVPIHAGHGVTVVNFPSH